MAAATTPTEAELRARLAPFGQEHVLNHWATLTPAEQATLAADITSLDLAVTAAQFKRLQDAAAGQGAIDDAMEPIPRSLVANAQAFPPSADMLAWEARGLELIGAGQVAAVLLAGGQGTRLGSDKPKGMFDLELPSGKTLFHLQAQRIARLQALAAEKTGRAGVVVPWYIMTSGATFEATRDFFAAHAFFGLDPANVLFFEQGLIPALTFDGKLILETKSSLFRAPNGNGGLYEALVGAGMLADMQRRGVRYTHVYCVDNILVKVADPVFVGYTDSVGVGCAAKVVPKDAPHEKVGVVCRVAGKFKVVEYSEIAPKTAERTNGGDGALTFNAGNIANHLFSMDFLKMCCERHGELTHHVARKAIPYCDEHGVTIKPPHENGMKLELFVFDVFEFADKMALMEVSRENEFSPLKNKKTKEGDKGTSESCRNDLYSLNRAYLHEAGIEVAAGVPVEISPLISYRGENLAKDTLAARVDLAANPLLIE